MRVAVIGTGRIGELRASALARLPEVEQVLLTDVDAARASALAQRLDGVALEDVDAIWAARPVGVVISSSTATHVPLVHAALDAGVPVLCEKPLTLSAPESQAIAAHAAEAGLPVLVGFQRRFDAAFGAIREHAAAELHGATHLLRLRHADVAPPPAGYAARAGTMFVDMCIHDFDAVRWIGGEVEAVTAVGARVLGIPGFEDDVDTAITVLQLASGAVAVVEASRQGPDQYEAIAELIGAHGTSTTPAHPAPTWLDRFDEAFHVEMAAFARALAGAAYDGATVDDATAALRIALAAERSARERRLVRVQEIG
jgi:myo-inositol 2-dehydrogenase/D-chiro-inositol 1-dehydrogenase